MLHPCEKILNVGVSMLDFLECVESFCQERKLLVTDKEIDHICYRVESHEEYRIALLNLADYGSILAESMIGGRPISTVLLHNPIEFKSWKISCIELPSPKLGSYYPSGWEHCEVVIGTPGMTPVNNREYLEVFTSQHPELVFDLRSIGKDINADVSLPIKFNDYKFSVKFHCLPLHDVCLFEKTHDLAIHVPMTS
jgi:predicted metalloenzyme YecM